MKNKAKVIISELLNSRWNLQFDRILFAKTYFNHAKKNNLHVPYQITIYLDMILCFKMRTSTGVQCTNKRMSEIPSRKCVCLIIKPRGSSRLDGLINNIVQDRPSYPRSQHDHTRVLLIPSEEGQVA